MAETLQNFRIQQITLLGFHWEDAEILAERFYKIKVSGKYYDMRVDHHYLKRMLDNGATHDQVLAIII